LTAMTRPETGPRPLLNRRLAEFGTTVFAEMSAPALRTGSINLGQGFPDTDGPEEVREAPVWKSPGPLPRLDGRTVPTPLSSISSE
jgi:N-succinyldiaminopimelate aminotransferase